MSAPASTAVPATAVSCTVFAHLNVDNTSLYRAILDLFVAERARFVISLRPSGILAALPSSLAVTPAVLDSALGQLRAWGNLDDTPDNADAATIEEFYQRRRLYQLSAAGEAAEQALAAFDAWLHRPGELQTAALSPARTGRRSSSSIRCSTTRAPGDPDRDLRRDKGP